MTIVGAPRAFQKFAAIQQDNPDAMAMWVTLATLILPSQCGSAQSVLDYIDIVTYMLIDLRAS